MFKKLKEGYGSLWQAIIRPPREEYSSEDLGPSQFNLHGRTFQRTDFTITNARGNKIYVSHFEPVESERVTEVLPCVVYLHGNCSSRLEGLAGIPVLMPSNITLVCLDFAGCGMSEGEYITLGWNEKEDLGVLVEHLRAERRVGAIGLWGRSMGAVTAIFYASQDFGVAGLVLDSPFSSFKKLAMELCKKYARVPGFVMKSVYSMVKKTCMKKTGMNLDELNPVDAAKQCFCPSLFGTGNDDDFVAPAHSKEVYEAYSGDKNILYMEGDHNSTRPFEFSGAVSDFFYRVLMCDALPSVDLTQLEGASEIPEFIERRSIQEDNEEMDEEAMIKMAIENSLKDS